MAENKQQPVVCMPGQGEAFTIAGMMFFLKVSGTDTGGAYGVMEVVIAPGGGFPNHRHAAQEHFQFLEGELTFQIEGDHFAGSPGTLVAIPSMKWHSFENRSQAPARMLITVVPAGLEEFIKEVAHVVVDRTAPPVAVDPEDVKRMASLSAQYQIESR